MITAIRIAIIALGVSTALLASSGSIKVWGRGGGGVRAGSYGGDFRGGMEDASRGRGDFGDPHDLYDQAMPHPNVYNSAPRPSEAALQSGANRSYNWGNNGRTLSTDGDFGRTAMATSPYGTSRVTAGELATRGEEVRRAYGYPDAFGRGWWGRYPGAWGWGGWGDGWAWGGYGWPELASYWGMPASNAPTVYDYGNNITYQNDTVYYGSQPAESAEAYYTQAQSLAQSVPASPSDNVHTQALSKNWKPLGVFSLVQGGQTNTTTMFQLAVNKKGAIKGNYYNALTGEVKPVNGAVDKKGMRVAWTVGTNKEVVYDTGLANLLSEQSSVLVHFGKSKTEQWTLVRLQQSKKTA